MWERVQETTPWSEGKVSVGKISPSRYVRLPARAGGGGGVGGGGVGGGVVGGGVAVRASGSVALNSRERGTAFARSVEAAAGLLSTCSFCCRILRGCGGFDWPSPSSQASSSGTAHRSSCGQSSDAAQPRECENASASSPASWSGHTSVSSPGNWSASEIGGGGGGSSSSASTHRSGGIGSWSEPRNPAALQSASKQYCRKVHS